MKFNIGEVVKIRDKSTVGEIIRIEYKRLISEDSEKEISKYLVKLQDLSQHWFYERDLELHLTITEDVEEQIRKLLIDVNLKNRNFEMVRMLVNDKMNNQK